jgi:transposase-like protein
MGKRRPNDITFAQIEEIARDPEKCRALVEALRFPCGLICPSCAAEPERAFVRHRTRPGVFTCGACRKQFSLTSGTAMHRTRLPLGQWIRAIWLIAASSKGISARKISEMLGITYKTAWHLGHRIRAMMIGGDLVLSGVVEMDEVYAGAPPRKRHGGGPTGAKTGRGPRRPLVLTIAERNGRVILRRIESHSTAAIKAAADGRIADGAIIATDALPAYRKVAAGHAHLTVTHSAGEYVARDPAGLGVDAHTNTAEAIHGEIRRAVIGVWHWISGKHLDRYLNELAWRRNLRQRCHLDRIASIFGSMAGPAPYARIVQKSP